MPPGPQTPPARRTTGAPARAPAAILTATERLLNERPLHQVSVGDIIAAAGISRTSFYAHFASKSGVIAACLRGVMDQITEAVRPVGAGDALRARPDAAIRLSLERWVAVCRRHGALLRAVSEEWPHDDELRDLWREMLGSMAAGTARMIRAARACGQAPDGADPAALAACLMWGYERVLHVAFVGDAVGLDGPETIVEPLAQMMAGGLFGRPLG